MNKVAQLPQLRKRLALFPCASSPFHMLNHTCSLLLAPALLTKTKALCSDGDGEGWGVTACLIGHRVARVESDVGM